MSCSQLVLLGRTVLDWGVVFPAQLAQAITSVAPNLTPVHTQTWIEAWVLPMLKPVRSQLLIAANPNTLCCSSVVLQCGCSKSGKAKLERGELKRTKPAMKTSLQLLRAHTVQLPSRKYSNGCNIVQIPCFLWAVRDEVSVLLQLLNKLPLGKTHWLCERCSLYYRSPRPEETKRSYKSKVTFQDLFQSVY